MSFKNKVVLITGASSGIGAATAELLTKEGASVAIVGRNEAKLQSVADKCEQAGQKPLVIKADVSDDNQAKSIIEQTIAKFSKLDVLVNNAGYGGWGSIIDGNILESYDYVMKTNVRAVIHLTTLAAPHLIKTRGNIVNISSISSTMAAPPGLAAYSISKAALDHFTRAAAKELGPSGVRVNSVNPGPVKTEFIENAGMTELITYEDLAAGTLLNRVLQAEEIADMVAFVASEKAIGVTGSVFVIDNGYLIN